MYGSILLVLSSLEVFGASAVSANPLNENAAPRLRQVEPDMGDLSGYYTCKGQEAGGKNYSGIAVLTKKSDVYLIHWVIGGNSTFSGIAIRQGNNLAASWSIASERGLIRGVNLYRIESTSSGPRLVGRWSSVPGPGVQQTEELRFLKKHEESDSEDE